MMLVSLIVAKSGNDVIGLEGRIPWHIPGDLRYFRKRTMGHYILFGRKTYESLPPLPGRNFIVCTRQKAYSAKDPVVHSVGEALSVGRSKGETEFFVGGGEQIYRESIGLADRLYVTEIDAEFAGDSYFPAISPESWAVISQKEGKKSDPNYRFIIYEKRTRR
jgi:dihydrofolate reductase